MQGQMELLSTRDVVATGAPDRHERSDLLPDDKAIAHEAEDRLLRRMWFAPGQVRVHVDQGTAVLTGEVGRRSTAAIAARLTAAVPGVTGVVNHIRYQFDDDALLRSRIGRTHPFSAEPFPPGPRRIRRRRIRLTGRRPR